MFGGKRWPRHASLLAVLVLALSGCDGPLVDGGSPLATASPTPNVTPSTFAATPFEGEEPEQQRQIAGDSVPRAFPVLLEETGTAAYLKSMVRINLAALKNRQAYEVMPTLVYAKGSVACTKIPGAKRQRVVYRVGDKAPEGSPLLAACVKGKKLVIYFAKKKFYQYYRNFNAPEVRGTVIRVVQEYLEQLARNRAGVYEDGYYAECAAGRLIGGLKADNYIESYWAGAQGIDGEVDTDGEKIYVTARDQGLCPVVWFGQKV